MVQLFVIGGHDVGRSAEVEHGSWVGRAEGSALRLGDRSISRKHARIEQRGDDWYLVDQGSTNGLWVGDERVDEVRLEDHGEFLAGEVLLRARFELAIDEVVAEPVAEPVVAPAPARPEPAIAFTSGGGAAAAEAPVEELELEWDDEPESEPPPASAAAPAPSEAAAAPASVRDQQRDQLLASLGRERSSLLSADLSQLPTWGKALVTVGFLAFLGLLAWGVSTLVLAAR